MATVLDATKYLINPMEKDSHMFSEVSKLFELLTQSIFSLYLL